MKRVAVAAVVVCVLGQAAVAAGGRNTIREAAERAAREVGLEASATHLELVGPAAGRRRSTSRTLAGILLMGVGTPVLVVGLSAEHARGRVCFRDDCVTIEVDTGGAGYGVAAMGGALVISGALLATVWSDVPILNSLDFSVAPQRLQVGRTFGF